MSNSGPTIVQATDPAAITTVRELFSEYAEELGIDLEFQGFAAELAGLPGAYAPPTGRLLLAVEGEAAIACVGLRALAETICEMKRLHVCQHARRRGVGAAMARAIIDAARSIGYRSMRLDTLASMTPAIRLYESLGFVRIDAYYPNPIADAVYFELRL